MPRKQYLFYRSSEEKVVGKRRNTERHKKTKEYEKTEKKDADRKGSGKTVHRALII
jgi:hypothetical protein